MHKQSCLPRVCQHQLIISGNGIQSANLDLCIPDFQESVLLLRNYQEGFLDINSSRTLKQYEKESVEYRM
jgi:hypothetical protein